MADFVVTKAHLKKACDAQDWDLLDKLLSISNKDVNYNSMYTDTWGEWWSMLMSVTLRGYTDGMMVLLKHGAKPKLKSWGDCIPQSPIEWAEEHNKTHLLNILRRKVPIEYERKTDPPLPSLSAEEKRLNRAAEVAEATGLQFQAEALEVEADD